MPGLKDFPRDERPDAFLVFYAFRVMVGLGFLMLGLALWGAWRRWRGNLYHSRPLLWSAVAMGPAGFIAVLSGWIVTEVGRQPFTVYGLLKTTDSVAPLQVEAVSSSLVAFIVVYFLVFGAGTFYLFRLMKKPPEAGPRIEDIGPTRTAGVTPAPASDKKFIPAE